LVPAAIGWDPIITYTLRFTTLQLPYRILTLETRI
jgi:hypothetical protein